MTALLAEAQSAVPEMLSQAYVCPVDVSTQTLLPSVQFLTLHVVENVTQVEQDADGAVGESLPFLQAVNISKTMTAKI